MPIDEVVADANVLLSAVLGHAALKIFTDFKVKVHVAEFNAAEVEEYLPLMALKYRLPHELVEMNWRLLPLIRHPEGDYIRNYDEAFARMKNRDPEDAHALALSRALRLPLWPNDRDFDATGVERYSTAGLLGALERR